MGAGVTAEHVENVTTAVRSPQSACCSLAVSTRTVSVQIRPRPASHHHHYPSCQTPHQASWHLLTDDGRPLSLVALLALLACWPSGVADREWDCVSCTLYHVLSDF